MKKAFKGKKKRRKALLTFEKQMFLNPRDLGNPLMTAMNLVKAMAAEADY